MRFVPADPAAATPVFANTTLVVPLLSLGHVPQLALDLVINASFEDGCRRGSAEVGLGVRTIYLSSGITLPSAPTRSPSFACPLFADQWGFWTATMLFLRLETTPGNALPTAPSLWVWKVRLRLAFRARPFSRRFCVFLVFSLNLRADALRTQFSNALAHSRSSSNARPTRRSLLERSPPSSPPGSTSARSLECWC